jgi:hypothetical protein
MDVLDHQHGRHPGVPQPFEQGGEQRLPEGELLDQRRLADACLTAHQDQSPATGPSLREPTAEGVERRFSLEEWHAPMIVTSSP